MGTAKLITVNKLKNRVKVDVLVTLYRFTIKGTSPGLALPQLSKRSGASYGYLVHRLPEFCGKKRLRLTGKFWRPALVLRRAAEVNGRPVFIYQLSAAGRRAVEESISQKEFEETVKRLSPRWRAVALKYSSKIVQKSLTTLVRSAKIGTS